VADKDDKKPAASAPASTPRFDPKPVQVGGESIADRLLPHIKKIVYVVIAAAVVVGAFSVVVWWRDRKESAKTNGLAQVLAVQARPVHPPEPEPVVGSGANPEKPDQKPEPKKDDNSFPDDKAKALAVLASLASHGEDVAGAAFRGSQLMLAGKLDDAIAAYRGGEHDAGVDGMLAREGLGLALEAKASGEKDATARQKGLEEALAAFRSVQPDEKAVGAGEALYHQGRVLVELGRRDEAKTAFTKAKAIAKEGDLSELIDQRLAMLGA
jgi:tetratricopeptide (TPR) repeat protein